MNTILQESLGFSLFEYNPIQTIAVDLEGKIVAVNLAKRTSGDRLPKIGDVMYRDYAGRHKIDMHAELMGCLASGKMKVFPELEYEDKILSVTISPFPLGAVIISEDISARKQREKDLSRQKMLLKSQLETSQDGILAVDKKGLAILRNERFGEMWKIPQFILDTKDDLRMLEAITSQLKNPEEFQSKVTYIYEHPDEKSQDEVDFIDGRRFDRYSAPMLGADGRNFGRIWFFSDITQLKEAEEKINEILLRLRKSLAGTLHVIQEMVKMRDPYTASHQEKVSDLAVEIAKEMGLSLGTIEIIRMATLIHDIGKVGIAAEILSKPGKLSPIEFELVKAHVEFGFATLKDSGLPEPVAQIVHQHHERLDGSGYPQGLKGDEILLEARILAVADVVEAITSHRPYRASLGIDAALEEITKNKGIFYDPAVVDACLAIFGRGFKFEE